jgi:hypothetical protein
MGWFLDRSLGRKVSDRDPDIGRDGPVPFNVRISGNQVTDYSYGRERSEVIGSTASAGTMTINVRSYRGDAIVTLQRDGSNSALYQFAVPTAGIRVTGRALRQ